MKKTSEISGETEFVSKKIIVEKKTGIIINLCLLLTLLIITKIIWSSISNNIFILAFISLYCLSCFTSIIKALLYESYFVINRNGFSYGKRNRFHKKNIVENVDYNWTQIKGMYFETITALHTSVFLVVVRNDGVKDTIGLSLLPLSKMELKGLIIKYSKRNDIFSDRK